MAAHAMMNSGNIPEKPSPPSPFGPRRGSLRCAARAKAGGAEGSRTPDLLIANEALYQLSYDPSLAVRTQNICQKMSRRATVK